jgi:tRNA pseudouridine55 synthase
MLGPRGFVVIDKPPGITSHDVVARVRRVFRVRRVGHGGTLDPMATGVLVIGIGDATRLLQWVSGGDKCYEATVRLGSSTLTDDSEGEVVTVATAEALSDVTEPAIGRIIDSFHGSIMQVPSTVSAVKRQGVRAYARVRAGETFELEPRPVVITSMEWRVLRRELDFLDLYLSVCCSSGTYVRALARDIGRALGVGGHLTSLRRTRVGGFSLDDAISLAELTDETLIPLAIAAQRILPAVTVSSDHDAHVRHGRPIPWPADFPGTVALLGQDGSLLAVCHDVQGVTRYDCVFA